MRIDPLILVAGAFGAFVLGVAVHPVFFIFALLGVMVWAIQFVAFLFR